MQAIIPNNDRVFDPFDILANVVGSALALFLSSWYHKRMLERRRKNKVYDIVPGDEPDEDVDVELGLVREQETGVVPTDANGGLQTEPGAKIDVTEELDNWDENAEDWDEGPSGSKADEPLKSPVQGGEDDAKKRTD